MTAISPGGAAGFFLPPTEPSASTDPGSYAGFALVLAEALGGGPRPAPATGTSSAPGTDAAGDPALGEGEAPAEATLLSAGDETDQAVGDGLASDRAAPGLAAIAAASAGPMVAAATGWTADLGAEGGRGTSPRPGPETPPAGPPATDGLLPAEGFAGGKIARALEQAFAQVGLAPVGTHGAPEASAVAPLVADGLLLADVVPEGVTASVLELVTSEKGSPAARASEATKAPSPAPDTVGQHAPPSVNTGDARGDGRAEVMRPKGSPEQGSKPWTGSGADPQAVPAASGVIGEMVDKRAAPERRRTSSAPAGPAIPSVEHALPYLARPGLVPAVTVVEGAGRAGALPPEPTPLPTPQSSVTLQLTDQDGARAAVRVAVRGDRVQATIVAQDASSAQRLGLRAADLERALLQQGFLEARVRVEGGRAGGPDSPGLSWAGAASSESVGRSGGGRGQEGPAEERREGERQAPQDQPKDRSQHRSRRERQR